MTALDSRDVSTAKEVIAMISEFWERVGKVSHCVNITLYSNIIYNIFVQLRQGIEHFHLFGTI
jgi:hypothetical protein